MEVAKLRMLQKKLRMNKHVFLGMFRIPVFRSSPRSVRMAGVFPMDDEGLGDLVQHNGHEIHSDDDCIEVTQGCSA
jgi:hypothetical protein